MTIVFTVAVTVAVLIAFERERRRIARLRYEAVAVRMRALEDALLGLTAATRKAGPAMAKFADAVAGAGGAFKQW